MAGICHCGDELEILQKIGYIWYLVTEAVHVTSVSRQESVRIAEIGGHWGELINFASNL